MSSANSSDAQPVYVQIPLPPGLTTVDQWFAAQKTMVIIAVSCSCVVTVMVWDYFVLLPTEIAVYRNMKASTWMKPTTIAFIILRYSIFLGLLPTLWFTALQDRHCMIPLILSQTGIILVTASAGVIFCYRVFSIWKFNRKVIVPIAILYIIMLACWVAVATRLGESAGPPTPVGSNCHRKATASWTSISFASSVLFDFVILAMTFIGLHRGDRMHSRIGRTLLNDSIIYFVLVTTANVIALVIRSANNELLKAVVLPYPCLMNTAMGTRVFANLKLFTSKHDGIEPTEPISNIIYASRYPASSGEENSGLEQKVYTTNVFSPGKTVEIMRRVERSALS